MPGASCRRWAWAPSSWQCCLLSSSWLATAELSQTHSAKPRRALRLSAPAPAEQQTVGGVAGAICSV